VRAQILVVDAGTTAVEGALTDGFRTTASSEVGLSLDRPAQGYAEQSADAWWAAFVTAVRRCGIADAGPTALAGQTQDLVMFDERDAPAATTP
jgi:sugar (pentulose or hexulose) kinase